MERAERVAVGRAWRAVPLKTRREVVRLAKAGRWHPDEAVAATAYRIVEASGLDSRAVRVVQRVCLIVGPLVLLEMLLLQDVVGIVLALVVIGIGLFTWDLRRDVGRLRALGPRPPSVETTPEAAR